MRPAGTDKFRRQTGFVFHGRGVRESQSLRPQHQSQVMNDPDFGFIANGLQI